MTSEPRDMTLPDLVALREKATRGPWVRQSRDDGVSDPWWLDTHAYPEGPEPVWAPPQYPVGAEDAHFIAAAGSFDYAATAARIEALEAALRAILGELGVPSDDYPAVALLDSPDQPDPIRASRSIAGFGGPSADG